jgi:arylsulfatase A-like enzyme
MDWTATILKVTGTEPDAAYSLDGEDLMPVCSGARAPYDRTLFWRNREYEAARMGKWKYLKLDADEWLFDLSVDPGEKVDRRKRQAETFATVRAKFQAWDAQMLPLPARRG